jgi:flavin-dependent dehydrogenase
MTEACDVLVVGAGGNGLVAAVVLADARVHVVVVERNQEPGDGPCWDRTSDLGIKSPLLYQLS